MDNSQLQTAKTLSLIGAIFAIVMGALYCLTIIGIILGIPMIIGGIYLLRLRHYNDDNFYAHRGAMLGWGIFFLFCTLVGGVLELVAYFQVNNHVPAANVDARPTMSFSSVERAYELKEKGVISQAEFEDIKAAALKQEGVDVNDAHAATQDASASTAASSDTPTASGTSSDADAPASSAANSEDPTTPPTHPEA
ncbi:SHOCT domain-containing protein [Lacticaseibacillus thailandensis]|uniref:SHOCT domain-containing protein n=1 Tax=Lacticaseibacillus thailandensis DSM 22698 = JCM 13996 TaxID=1423810 RepID=A0A0R2C409_9LACO|nr:SHOCT domain-containing protein [Lacticaseibacillus thailandensis]KRM86417.1 hypothetical protein FD19_GL000745 [Lacticaseibacillus thailandensis DSM 22698 = JCM 13996]